MKPRLRIALAVSLTAIVAGAFIVFTIARARRWEAVGYAGLTYMQAIRPGQPKVFGLSGGQVFIAYPDGPADKGGLRRADEILTIDGIPIHDVERLKQLDARVKKGDPVLYRIRRGRETHDLTVRFGSFFSNPYVLLTCVVNTLVALVFIAIGVLVFSQKPGDRRANVFFAMVTFGALTLLGSMVLATDPSALRGIVANPNANLSSLLLVLGVFLGFLPLTLHLALIFPHDRAIVRTYPAIVTWVYAVPITALLVTGSFILLVAWLQSAGREAEKLSDLPIEIATASLAIAAAVILLRLARKGRDEGTLRAFLSRPVQTIIAVIGGLFAVCWAFVALRWKIPAITVGILTVLSPYLSILSYPVLSCIALYRSYREAGLEERRQVKWPLWGTLIALATKIIFGVTLYGTMFALIIGGADFSGWTRFMQVAQLLPTLLYLLIPISFAVAIFKYRLMNIDVLIKKTVAYGILSGLIIVIYLVLVGGLGTVLVNVVGVRNQTMVIASTLVVALVFVPLRNRLQHLVDRNLFRQKYDYPQALKVLAAETLTARDSRAFHHITAETLQQALQIRSVVIFERQQDELITSAKVGLPDSVLGSVRMDAGEAEAIDRALNPKRRALPEGTASALRRVDTALAVPVRSQGMLHAVLALGPKLSDREFDLEDLEFLASAADQIGITVDRLRMQRDEEDFEQARAMQQSLMPATVPFVEGLDVSGTWKPARAVGGDYYDLLRLSETQLAVCIGDVAGKGMPAALLMAALQAAVRASAAPGVSPLEVCERVRRVIVQSLSGGRFVTFFYCTIDTAAKRVRYCNAGHNPPVLVRADGGAIRLDQGGSVLSRLFSKTPFHQGEEEIREGDRLVLFTDGVSEARDTAGNDFSEERLERIIAANRTSPARELIATILDSVSSFSEGRIDDDLTLVVVAIG
jgi:Stage II sporulation protein E (SpoIIE)/GAF domain/PDZ domain